MNSRGKTSLRIAKFRCNHSVWIRVIIQELKQYAQVCWIEIYLTAVPPTQRNHVSFYPSIFSKQRGQTIHHAYHTCNALLAVRVSEYLDLPCERGFLASSNPQTDDPMILTAETRCDGKLWRAGGWPVHRVRALVKTNLSIALESGGAGSAERRRSARSLAAPMESSITAAGVVVVWFAAVTSVVYAAARRDSSLLGVYGRRVSVGRVRVASAIFGPPRTRQPRRTFVRVEAERGLRGDGSDGGGKVKREEEEDEASRGGFPFSYGRYIPIFSSSTYLVNSVTIRHFLFLAK
ncbi:hypothetical protein G5I_13056 [Acromyrmex echinatior]|uniref:Uncharacterized protein n=1 Tax=Acromyrmex echinatior TaxID=103372 RepID=F4X3Z3_ACREC|nr:hypothetical protein G5I_13056 [Acromyrmex echinatior]